MYTSNFLQKKASTEKNYQLKQLEVVKLMKLIPHFTYYDGIVHPLHIMRA